MKIMYRGQDIEELEKPELFLCIEWCMKELEREKKNHKGTLDLMTAFARARP